MKHQKHAKLTRPIGGKFGRNEIAFVGAPCGIIQEIARAVIAELPKHKIAYVDADHAAGDASTEAPTYVELTDKITFKRIDFQDINEFQQRFLLNEQDLVLVNGNHFQAEKQVVFIHPKKEESLRKRIGQLTNVVGIVLCEGCEKPFDWLAEISEKVPVFYLKNSNEISKLIRRQIVVPPLKALVLVGGKSTRMGSDKSEIVYHGKPQSEFLYETLESIGIETFLSVQGENKWQVKNTLSDTFVGLGPFGAILSAFQSDPNAAWLVVACDMPFVNEKIFQQLVAERNSSKIATAFFNSETNFPDPLLTIYEPKAYLVLLQFLSLGYSCPRKVLINSDTEIIVPFLSDVLKNANTPEEMETALQIIARR